MMAHLARAAKEAADAAALLGLPVREQPQLAVADRRLRVKRMVEHAVDGLAAVLVDVLEPAAHHEPAALRLGGDGEHSDAGGDLLREEAAVEAQAVPRSKRLQRRERDAGRREADDTAEDVGGLREYGAPDRLDGRACA